jgi:hypothetical protein
MRRASAYRLRDRFLFCPEAKTTSGVWLATAPYVSAPLDSGPETLGEAIAAALAASGSAVPHPTSWTGLSKARLDAAGSRSETDFMRGAQLVSVTLDAATMTLEATHNGGTKGKAKGFSELRASARELPASARSDEVGAAFCEMLSRCSSVE